MAHVYILYSASRDRYYIGSTTDFRRRFAEHSYGHTTSTRSGRPWACVFQSDEMSFAKARKIEFKLKKWKSRVILEKIIREGLVCA